MMASLTKKISNFSEHANGGAGLAKLSKGSFPASFDVMKPVGYLRICAHQKHLGRTSRANCIIGRKTHTRNYAGEEVAGTRGAEEGFGNRGSQRQDTASVFGVACKFKGATGEQQHPDLREAGAGRSSERLVLRNAGTF
jgi:hypothetical protein